MTNIISQAARRLRKYYRNRASAKSGISHHSQMDYSERFQMTLREWLIYHHKDIVYDKCTWMGVRALKNPFDAWIYQEIIYEVKPDVIVEIGSAEGGSTLFFANLLDLLGSGTVVSVDIDSERERYILTYNPRGFLRRVR